MKRTREFAGPSLAFAGSVAALVTLGLGESIPRWVMFGWPIVTILWSLVVIVETGANRLNRKTIEWQNQIIQEQGQFIGELIKDFGGRE